VILTALQKFSVVNYCLLLLFLLTLPLFSQEKITYDDHVFPILEQSCLNCHNPDKKKGDLDLSSYPALLIGGSGGKVVIPGDGASSRLYTVTTGSEDPVMPPKGDRIERKASDLIRAWIDGGLLETAGSAAQKPARPKLDLAVDTTLGKPEGPPPMPARLSLDPAFIAPRSGLVKAMTASPWAPLIAFTGQKQILLYHSETFRFLGSLPFPEGQPEFLSFHPSGKYLLASGGIAGKSGHCLVWDITTGKELFRTGREFDSVLAAAVTPNLATVAMGGPTRLLKIWNTRENAQSTAIKKHTDWITSLAASPDGKFFASGDRNGGIHVWDTAGNEIHSLRDHRGAVTALAFRADSKLLASTSEDGQLIIWDLKKGSAAKKVKAHNAGITTLHYHRDGHLVTAGRDRVAKLFKPDFNEKHSLKNLPEIVTAIALSQDGKHLFTADYDGEVLVYDISSNKSPVATLESNPPSLEHRLASLRNDLHASKASVQEAQKQHEQTIRERDNLQARINGTQQALKKNEAILKDLARQIRDVQEASAADEADEADEVSTAERIDNLARQQGEVRSLVKTGRQSLQSLNKKLPELKKILQGQAKELTTAQRAEETLRQEIGYWEGLSVSN
jgi:WD40 repeat protein